MPPGGLRPASRRSRRTNFNLAALLQLVLAVGHHNFARGDSAGDHGNVVLREGNGDRAHIHRIVRLHHEHVSSLRTPLNGRCRDRGTVLPNFQQQADVHELIWPKRVVLVVEHGFKPPGAGGLVDLIVDGQQFAGGQLGLIVAAVGVHLERALRHLLRHRLKVVFRQREENRDRLKLRDHEHGVRVSGVNDVPRIDLPQANPSGHRRRDVAIDQIQLGTVDGRLIVAHRAFELVDRGLLRIHLLLRHGAGFCSSPLKRS